ncbi:MAG: hypothetical protein HFI03_11090 [Lachnospiraceae bacterium]|jgi:hypothetical protein|nr:hypothetical protein [Lachnospiraceae bacterium]
MKLFKDMKFWKKIFRSRQDEEGDELDFEDESWERIESNRSKFNVHDWDQRKEYVQDCRDRIREASEELENLSFEYGKVTSYLKDIEEIEALPEEERKELNASAEKIQELESRRGAYLEKKNRMSDEKYHQMERMEDEAEEGLRKLSETEDYQNLIRKDMSRLDGEKHAYLYRKDELKGMIADAKGMTIICSVALIVCFVVLFTLKYALRMDIQVGFLLTTGLAALVITLLFIKYTESVKELKRVEKGINRIIMLHNRVKIRYVNNTNLLDYLYMKYKVSSAKEFLSLWEKYKVEKEERRRYREAELELDECQQELLSILKCYQVKDPAIWLHQTAAILDNKEMVEIRHGLIIRRQSLRRRMDYNREMIIEKTKGEMKELAEAYPQYAGELGWK